MKERCRQDKAMGSEYGRVKGSGLSQNAVVEIIRAFWSLREGGGGGVITVASFLCWEE